MNKPGTGDDSDSCSSSALCSISRASGSTGPPTKTTSSISGMLKCPDSAFDTLIEEGRLTIKPVAPSLLCSSSKTTVLWKFGSRSDLAATRQFPFNESDMNSLLIVSFRHAKTSGPTLRVGRLDVECRATMPGDVIAAARILLAGSTMLNRSLKVDSRCRVDDDSDGLFS